MQSYRVIPISERQVQVTRTSSRTCKLSDATHCLPVHIMRPQRANERSNNTKYCPRCVPQDFCFHGGKRKRNLKKSINSIEGWNLIVNGRPNRTLFILFVRYGEDIQIHDEHLLITFITYSYWAQVKVEQRIGVRSLFRT